MITTPARRGGALLTALVVAAAVAWPMQADAREPNAKATRFEKRGKQAYVKRQWDDAIAAFESAYDADPLPRFLFNIGRAYEKQGEYHLAIDFLQRYEREATGEEDKTEAQDLITMVRRKLTKTRSELTVSSDPPYAAVLVRARGENVVAGNAPFSTWLEFGSYEVEVSHEQRGTERRTVVVRPNTPVKLTVELGGGGGGSPSPTPPPPDMVASKPEPAEDPPPEAKPEPSARQQVETSRLGAGPTRGRPVLWAEVIVGASGEGEADKVRVVELDYTGSIGKEDLEGVLGVAGIIEIEALPRVRAGARVAILTGEGEDDLTSLTTLDAGLWGRYLVPMGPAVGFAAASVGPSILRLVFNGRDNDDPEFSGLGWHIAIGGGMTYQLSKSLAGVASLTYCAHATGTLTTTQTVQGREVTYELEAPRARRILLSAGVLF